MECSFVVADPTENGYSIRRTLDRYVLPRPFIDDDVSPRELTESATLRTPMMLTMREREGDVTSVRWDIDRYHELQERAFDALGAEQHHLATGDADRPVARRLRKQRPRRCWRSTGWCPRRRRHRGEPGAQHCDTSTVTSHRS